ncbi:N-acetylmuramoyl-L-alanine amidase [Bacteroidales bacterium OttesenSCG-928-A17]|nr:N-acetylmuramoyl-L-alanine amidase [Bacteroidales bacterium OttesenSCG-928-A17]
MTFPTNIHAKENTFVVVIDPGHGGKDPGAVGKKGKEKDINLAVALLTGKHIREAHPDVKVVYTREKDVFIGLDERANIANKANANLFISIHCNASKNSRAGGAEVFTFGLSRSKENLEVAKRENAAILLEDNYEQKYEGFDPHSAESYIIFEFMQNKFVEQSVDFASLVQTEFINTAGRKNRGVKQAEYLVLRKSSMPRILIELDFISNPEAEKYLLSQKGQDSLGRCIGNAFSSYKKEYDRKQGNFTVSTKEPNPEKNTEESKPATGKIYKIQILASPKQLKEKDPQLKGHKADFYFEKKLYKYTVGESSDWNEIQALRKKVQKDFKDAFIVAFENGVKVAN